MGDFATTRSVRARKHHRCGECFRAIVPAETYERSAGSWEGDFWTMKSCSHCAAFRSIIDDVDNTFYESMYGGISAWVDNTGSSAAELAYYHARHPRYTALALYRWSRQFASRWLDGTDPIPELVPKEDS